MKNLNKGNKVEHTRKRRRKKGWEKKIKSNVRDINTNILVITLKSIYEIVQFNGSIVILNKNLKDPTISCLQETYFRYKNIHRLHIEEWKETFSANTSQKKAGITKII